VGNPPQAIKVDIPTLMKVITTESNGELTKELTAKKNAPQNM
jgi:hypothetical protein